MAIGGLGNWLIPVILGVSSLTFPWLSNISFWVLLPMFLLLLSWRIELTATVLEVYLDSNYPDVIHNATWVQVPVMFARVNIASFSEQFVGISWIPWYCFRPLWCKVKFLCIYNFIHINNSGHGIIFLNSRNICLQRRHSIVQLATSHLE